VFIQAGFAFAPKLQQQQFNIKFVLKDRITESKKLSSLRFFSFEK
jgi:hypothetical protein